MLNISVMVTTYPGCADKYREAALRHANNAFTKEEGCLGFAVHAHENDPNRFLLYESYISRDFFETVHTKTPYLAAFRDLTAPWVKSKELVIWERISPEQKKG